MNQHSVGGRAGARYHEASECLGTRRGPLERFWFKLVLVNSVFLSSALWTSAMPKKYFGRMERFPPLSNSSSQYHVASSPGVAEINRDSPAAANEDSSFRHSAVVTSIVSSPALSWDSILAAAGISQSVQSTPHGSDTGAPSIAASSLLDSAQPSCQQPPALANTCYPAVTMLGKRKDTPVLAHTKRANRSRALAVAADPAALARAMEELIRDQVASTAGRVLDIRMKTWSDYHFRYWSTMRPDVPPPEVLPLTVAKIQGVCSILKAGGYRAGKDIIARAKDEHIQSDYPWSSLLARTMRLCIRSVERGIGPARQSEGIPLEEVVALKLDSAPLVLDGPCAPGRMVIAASMFCMREIEVALALVGHITIDTEKLIVEWLLPCSKSDVKALGKVRHWGCICSTSEKAPCAYHAIAAQLEYLTITFGASPVSPLFPTLAGEVVEKDKVVDTIEAVAQLLRIPIRSSDGDRRFGGHSFRVTGARYLASRGMPLHTIQLHARWSSDVIARYVADTPLDRLTDQFTFSSISINLAGFCRSDS